MRNEMDSLALPISKSEPSEEPSSYLISEELIIMALTHLTHQTSADLVV